MSPEELDEVARRHRFRRALKLSNFNFVVPVGIVSVSWPVMGIGFALVGSDLGERLRGIAIGAVGCAIAWVAWRYVRRPVRPERNDDFERELRHRGLI
jgi:hypothetical protein